jgi:hypothetical protein
MSSSKKPPTEYDKLRAIWYKKLEESGFEDIEQDDDKLKAWSSRFAHDNVRQLMEDRQPYYRLCDRFLNEFKFDSNFETVIWEYHSNGLSNKQIDKLFKETKAFKTNRHTIWLIIKRLEKTMLTMYVSKEGRDG